MRWNQSYWKKLWAYWDITLSSYVSEFVLQWVQPLCLDNSPRTQLSIFAGGKVTRHWQETLFLLTASAGFCANVPQWFPYFQASSFWFHIITYFIYSQYNFHYFTNCVHIFSPYFLIIYPIMLVPGYFLNCFPATSLPFPYCGLIMSPLFPEYSPLGSEWFPLISLIISRSISQLFPYSFMMISQWVSFLYVLDIYLICQRVYIVYIISI